MDDDARTFRITEGGGPTVGWKSREVSFSGVAERLVLQSKAKPGARLIGINHWYHHAVPVSKPGAVQEGLQHMTFQPALLNFPSPLPLSLTIRWSMIDDEEFAWRVAEQYGPSGVVKMRYLIGKFDVGEMAGGLQGTSVKVAIETQSDACAEAISAHPEVFEWRRKTNQSGRLCGPRVRLKVDWRKNSNVSIGGVPAGKVIEKRVGRRGN